MICFLDVDGVLVNFRQGIHKEFNIPYDYSTLSKKWTFWEDWGNVTFQEVDSTCTADFWAGLRWMHDGKEILQLVEEKFGPENIYLLTTPMPNPGSGTGKMQWVQRHMPEYSERLIITTAPKYLFARSNTILIDDKDDNAGKFYCAGGKFIIVPRPWNTMCFISTSTLLYLQGRLCQEF